MQRVRVLEHAVEQVAILQRADHVGERRDLAVAHDRQLRDRVALHHVDRLADLLVRRDRDERRRLVPASSAAARAPSASVRERSRKPCSSIQLSSRNFERYERPESGSIVSTRDVRPEAARVDERAGDRRAGRAADEQPLLAREPARGQERVAVGDAHPLVDDVGSIVSGHVSLPIPSTKYGCRSLVGLRRVDGALGVDADDQHLGLALLEVAADAADRAAGADRDHDRVDLAAGLLPDLRPGRRGSAPRGSPCSSTGRA